MILLKISTTLQRLMCLKNYSTNGINVPLPLRNLKQKSRRKQVKHFVDVRRVRAVAGSGGDGCVSFLQLWANEHAGPDGGDGGNGGHVLLQASSNIKDLDHIECLVKGEDGEKGHNKNCHGKSADHVVLKVPVGTLVHDSGGIVVGDLSQDGSLFVLARGGRGGRGNCFFASPTQQRPAVAEYGAQGEDLVYTLELRTIAAFGLLGMPNAGKSTLLQAITRARPKVAPYPFTTLKPHVGMVPYDDYLQIPVADLPGLIEGSHKNRGLGVDFLRHAQRCSALALVVDTTSDPVSSVALLRHELQSFSKTLADKPWLVLANKIDLLDTQDNLLELEKELKGVEVIPISAKFGTNLTRLLIRIRELYDEVNKEEAE